MRALSIRQPYAEMILRGIKTVEYRSRPTRIIGERFHIYASKRPAPANGAGGVWSRDLAMTGAKPGDAPPAWMVELAELLILKKLPTGVIVGTAVIERVTRVDSCLRFGDLIALCKVLLLLGGRLPLLRRDGWFLSIGRCRRLRKRGP